MCYILVLYNNHTSQCINSYCVQPSALILYTQKNTTGYNLLGYFLTLKYLFHQILKTVSSFLKLKQTTPLPLPVHTTMVAQIYKIGLKQGPVKFCTIAVKNKKFISNSVLKSLYSCSQAQMTTCHLHYTTVCPSQTVHSGIVHS